MTQMKHILTALLFALIGTWAVAQSEYRVQPGDTLSIEVLEDSTLNRSVVVLPDGNFTFPFAGSVRASGRNATEIGTAITSGIQSNYSSPPTVFVTVQPAAQRFAPPVPGASGRTIDIFMLGEVNSPGVVAVEPGTTLLQALTGKRPDTPLSVGVPAFVTWYKDYHGIA